MISNKLQPKVHGLVDQLLNHPTSPHDVLGVHRNAGGGREIRIYRPGATEIHLEVRGEIVTAQQVDVRGLFVYPISEAVGPDDYRIFHQSGLLAQDPYVFRPALGELDLYLFKQGVHYELYKVLGAQQAFHRDVSGVQFAVWAPGARAVSLVGDFNYWDGRQNPMINTGHSGVWMLFVPGLHAGAKYKFEVIAQDGAMTIKADPFAFHSELRPATASIVADLSAFAWHDQQWIEQRTSNAHKNQPMVIYEVHLGSWKKENGHFMNYRRLAVELAAYCREMAYTHVELLPVQEHALDESWGYQVTGFYAPTSRHGSPQDFQWFVNHLHEQGIGVILDWVPGHFPMDNFALGRFDGTALYEHFDSRQGIHPHWNTYIFNLGRYEVSNFLIANALYWLDVMHIDGLRVDAVASMLYLDYGREHGEWIPNRYGRHESLEAIEFFKHLNSIAHERFPGVLTIAEESTAFCGVSHGVNHGGLGFDMKWNMGWMHDTLHYFSTDMIFRHYHQRDLTFGLLYAFAERFVLSLSHDEVVHGKGSLLNKMPGDIWQKFANLRLLYSYMICQPGKKLLFMGGDIGQWNEWNCKGELEWYLLQYPTHSGLQLMIKEINRFYAQEESLWSKDFNHETFAWVDCADEKNSVISYLRKGERSILLCVHNFTPVFFAAYWLAVPGLKGVEEIFNSDAHQYGGSGQVNSSPQVAADKGCTLKLAPLATMVFKVTF